MPSSPYTADRPAPERSPEELRRDIPGWGADLDPADRPAVPRERFAPDATGAHWEYPEEQLVDGYRERSIEHARLTPVFGTSVPLKGLSGVVRRLAYERFSEARAAHWLLLVLGDRIDAIESYAASFARGTPDPLLAESGVRAELGRHGLRSRLGRRRADSAHAWMDPLLVAAPWLLAGTAAVVVVTRLVRRH